jgi:MFS superfamily sulfate permease-like transporter
MLGVAVTTHGTVDQLRELVGRLPRSIARHWPYRHWGRTILACRKALPRLPVPLIAVIGGIAVSRAYDFAGRGIDVIGPVPGGLPALRFPMPTMHELRVLLPIAASCFAIIIAQSAAAARVFAQRHASA